MNGVEFFLLGLIAAYLLCEGKDMCAVLIFLIAIGII